MTTTQHTNPADHLNWNECKANKCKLINESKSSILAEEVLEAKTFLERTQGLLGRSTLPEQQTLLIKNCNSIHTWFMKFTIDAVFVNRSLKVKAIRKNISPWKFIFPILTARHVFEFSAGHLPPNLEIGDQLNVVPKNT